MKLRSEFDTFYLKVKLYSYDKNMFDEFSPILINFFFTEFSLFFSELEYGSLFLFNKINKKPLLRTFSIKLRTQNYNKTKQYITVIRSPHKYKDSREQFNLKIFNQTLYFIFPDWVPAHYYDWLEGKILNFFYKYFKSGVQIRLEFYKPVRVPLLY